MQKITPYLWFDDQAEEAVNFYVGIFNNAKINNVSRYPTDSPGTEGKVMLVNFELNGQQFAALNGGPVFSFNEAISFQIDCKDQAEVDHYWNGLSSGGETVQCGWLKDKYGVSWQVVPIQLGELLSDPDPEKVNRVYQAMLKMIKLDIKGLQQAYSGL
jgi:predicted 3-demethylubiquinone-9 3-methyltransferase (glyoxalase superfamily)